MKERKGVIYKGVNNIADYSDKYRKVIKGGNQRELEKRVADAEKQGWYCVGQLSVSHGAYRSYYAQTMERAKEWAEDGA